MPLMPAPPMPTKCTRLTLCFMPHPRTWQCDAARDARCTRRRRVGRIALADAMRGDRHRQRLRARQCAEHAGERRVGAGQFGLRHHDRGAGVEQEARVRGLLVGDRAGQRHDDRAQADRGELRDGERAAAADDEVGPCVARRHVVDERHAFGVDARASHTRRAARRCGARRPGARRSGARASGSRASADRHALVQCRAPRLPPTTSRRSGPARSGEALRGRRDRDDRRRAADCRPTSRASTRRRATRRGKPSSTRSAP